ncbi:hypothetical protein LSH36_497g01010 [Paralvinella palmiformis]|uniref:Uncharacterized protein n=1 Tax=Paralvinella palmiformis TaxID=53620 RepID=A0AAD9J909_9ANNE|nr:hypothetical protein LSH36_497g01010 [Paralvinella palmiformis]
MVFSEDRKTILIGNIYHSPNSSSENYEELIQDLTYLDPLAKEAKTRPKSFWTYVKNQTKSREGLSPLMTERGEMTSTDTKKAQVLNSFFSSLLTNEDLSTMPDIDPVDVQEPLTKTESLISEVEKELTKMKSNKSPGPDLVHPKVLKMCAQELAMPLTKIFKKSMEEGKVPTSWKDANVTPIFKKGTKAANKGNQVIGAIRHSFSYTDKDMLTQLYKALVRGHLEYGNMVWNPINKGDQDKLEKVERRATKLVTEIRDLPYQDRLRALRYRCEHGNIMKTYKILHRLEDMAPDSGGYHSRPQYETA